MTLNISRRGLLGAAALGAAGAAGALGRSVAPAPAAARPLGTPAWQVYGPDEGIALLARNENPYGPAPSALAAVAEGCRFGGAYYTDKTESYLRSMIAEKNMIDPSQVVISTGSGEVLSAIALAFAKDGAILAPELFWDTTVNYAAAKGATVLRAPLKEDFSIDLDALKAAVTDEVALVHICNPNNPTGMVLDGDALRSFCREVAPQVPVLIDEAYNELTDDPDYTSMMDLVRAGENVIVARTFSKIYGMAGMRVGYAMATPELVEKFASYVMAWPSVAGMAGAIGCYNDEEFLAFSKARILEAREMVTAAADAAGLSYLPAQTNFFWVDVGQSAETVRARFAEKGVIIRGIYGDYTNWSRVSMGKIEDVQRYVDALPEAVGA